LLSYETTNKVITLLEHGFSWRKTAQLADVSVSTVQRIANGKRSLTKHSKPVLDCFTALVNSEHYIPLELRGDVLRRYLDVRNQKLANLTNS
jgi:hypothetical protein